MIGQCTRDCDGCQQMFGASAQAALGGCTVYGMTARATVQSQCHFTDEQMAAWPLFGSVPNVRPSRPSPPSPSPQPASAAYYIGCFNDNGPDGRDLRDDDGAPGAFARPVTAGSGFDTVMECAQLCNADGFRYMGLQWVNECFCGNQFGAQDEARPTDCDTDGEVEDGGIADLCGDGENTCGNRNAIYNVATVLRTQPRSPPPSPPAPDWGDMYYIGCFNDNNGERDLKDDGDRPGLGPEHVTAGSGFDTVME
eukprot:SAG31_NODE_5253_length_2647_cov_2.193485_1_plen_252_part_10